MPRNYTAKPGAKRYKKYDKQIIKQALEEISANNTLTGISKKYNIPKSVLCRHKNPEIKPHGRPTALTEEEELYIVKNLNICGDWGYPLDATDLRHIIKMYLDSINIKHHIFKNNMPGIDYVNGFLKRHSDKLSQRICQNIKRSRGQNKKCGIVPLDAHQVLARLPMQEENNEPKETAVNDSFLKFLKEIRYGSMNIREPNKKRKLEVVAGRSVTAEEVERNQDQKSVKPKKKSTLKEKNELTPKLMSLKGKGIGKKTKPKIDKLHINEADQNKNAYSNVVIPDNFSKKSCTDIVVLDPYCIEDLTFLFTDDLDCEEITIRTTDDECQNQYKQEILKRKKKT